MSELLAGESEICCGDVALLTMQSHEGLVDAIVGVTCVADRSVGRFRSSTGGAVDHTLTARLCIRHLLRSIQRE